MEITTLEGLRSYFDSIPKERWSTRLIEHNGAQCSMAHTLGITKSMSWPKEDEEGNLISDWSNAKTWLQSLGVNPRVMMDENDGHPKDPKGAVLSYINLLIRMKHEPSTINTGGI